MTLHELKNVLDVSYDSVQTTVTKKLGYSRICVKWVPKLLTVEHKNERVRVAKVCE